jgi:dihydropteroate synthase
MGVVNVTPDSFSDGGRYVEPAAAVAHAKRLVEEGADILDVGGESSRPGALPVSAEEELERVLPVLDALRDAGLPLSIDTVKPQVMHAALDRGASMVNDVNALRAPGAAEAVAATRAAVCLMHMQGEPSSARFARISPSARGPRRRQASTATASCSTRASDSASRSRTISRCSATFPPSPGSDTRSWSAFHANPRSAP